MDIACTPNDVQGTEKQIKEHIAQRNELLEDLESSTGHGQTLLECIKGDNPRTPMVQLSHVLDVERWLLPLFSIFIFLRENFKIKDS
ncbi:hypothetical protein DPMN_134658 [Dreissena polymorpha]|uniref:Uncharacterized protein n=1 Tax=Dreissena polymorpha TaxID=45954 RepID=A0A9D4FZD6_DREPO|nr:hypothetical protein DPMN_134658 [Dreissena polymorpha]